MILNIKLFKSIFSTVLYIVGTSVDTGWVPDSFKVGVMFSIPKVSNPVSPSEFKPINLLPAVNKVLEIVLCEQLRSYVEKKKRWSGIGSSKLGVPQGSLVSSLLFLFYQNEIGAVFSGGFISLFAMIL